MSSEERFSPWVRCLVVLSETGRPTEGFALSLARSWAALIRLLNRERLTNNTWQEPTFNSNVDWLVSDNPMCQVSLQAVLITINFPLQCEEFGIPA